MGFFLGFLGCVDGVCGPWSVRKNGSIKKEECILRFAQSQAQEEGVVDGRVAQDA